MPNQRKRTRRRGNDRSKYVSLNKSRCKPTTKMKYLAAIALLASGAAAFAPTALVSRTSALSMAPAGGSPAASHEEDLDKTYKVCAVVCAVSEDWGINDA